jgi:peptidoglycan/xylan/chitin deacetylase (PgdA/CDA1 family)
VRPPSPARLAFLGLSWVSSAVLALAALRGDFGGLELSLIVIWAVGSTLGVFFPWLEMYLPCLWRGPEGRSEIALTFDDGPHPETTSRVLSAFAGTRHRATFFVLGEKVRKHPRLVRDILGAGHTLGIHGDVHDRLHSFRGPGRVAGEIASAQSAVEAACGVRPEIFRPPLGHTSPLTARGIRRAGVRVVGWSARAYDGLARRDPDAIMSSLGPRLGEGAIVVLHDAAERDDFTPASISVLPRLLALLDERGLTSVGLSRWMQAADGS